MQVMQVLEEMSVMQVLPSNANKSSASVSRLPSYLKLFFGYFFFVSARSQVSLLRYLTVESAILPAC